MQKLINERFIDDRRYAEAFVKEKIRLSAWGKYKITTALKRKSIADDIITETLAELTPSDNKKRLQDRLQAKIKHIKYDTEYQLKTKLIRYALSLGFEMDEVMDSVNEVMRNNNIKECDD